MSNISTCLSFSGIFDKDHTNINVSAISEGTVMKVTKAIERGFWINPDSFYKNRVQDTVPDGCVIVTSEKVILDSGRTIF